MRASKAVRRGFGCVAVAASVVSAASAAHATFIATPLLTEGQPVPNSPFTVNASGLVSTTVTANGIGGWAATVNTNDGPYVVGRVSSTSTAGPILRGASVGITGGFGQTVGLDNLGRALVSGGNRYVLGTTISSTTFLQASTALPEPLAGLMNASGRLGGDIFWVFGLTHLGTPVYRAVGRNAAGTVNERWAMVRGLPDGSPTIIAQTLQPVPNLIGPITGEPLTLSAVGSARAFGVGASSFSRVGDQTIVEGILRTGVDGVTTNDDQVMLVNGQALVLGGSVVRERTLISPSIGGQPQEDWRVFRSAAINSSGKYLFTAQAFQVGGGFRELLVKDGQILYRTGSTLTFGSTTLTITDASATYPVAINESGDWAAVLSTNAGRAIVVNGTPLLLQNVSGVDTTGDGIPNATLNFISADIGRLALGERGSFGQFELFFYGSTSTAASPLSVMSVVVPEPAAAGGVAVAALAVLRRRVRR